MNGFVNGESCASLRDQTTIVLALRKGPRARSGLAKALKAAGNTGCKPGGDDRAVVFALDALARKGYLIWNRADARGHCRFHLIAEPVTPACPRCGDPGYIALPGQRFCGNPSCDHTVELPAREAVA